MNMCIMHVPCQHIQQGCAKKHKASRTCREDGQRHHKYAAPDELCFVWLSSSQSIQDLQVHGAATAWMLSSS